jgi:CheY-like chemotaxis protein
MKPTHRVYVVDDEPLIASTLAAILSDSGYEVEFFTNPLVALAAVAPGLPAILVSDVTMPDLTLPVRRTSQPTLRRGLRSWELWNQRRGFW